MRSSITTHPASEAAAGAVRGLWGQPGFVHIQRQLRRKRDLLRLQLRATSDPTDIEIIRQQLHIIAQRVQEPPAGVNLKL